MNLLKEKKIQKFFFLTDQNLVNFQIYTSNFVANETTLCAEVTHIVKRPTSTEFSQYECFTCSETNVGSFVKIIQLDANKVLYLADVQIFGKFIRERGKNENIF